MTYEEFKDSSYYISIVHIWFFQPFRFILTLNATKMRWCYIGRLLVLSKLKGMAANFHYIIIQKAQVCTECSKEMCCCNSDENRKMALASTLLWSSSKCALYCSFEFSYSMQCKFSNRLWAWHYQLILSCKMLGFDNSEIEYRSLPLKLYWMKNYNSS